jgi:polyferredoxin
MADSETTSFLKPVFWKGSNLDLKWVRQAFQWIFFGLWYYTFFRTYVTADNLIKGNPVPDFFLRIDPLAGIISSATARAFAQEIIWWVPLIGLTVLVGRAFCGWVCPLGTWLDIYDHFVKILNGKFLKIKARLRINKIKSFRRFTSWKFCILISMMAAALFSVSLSGYLDPLCIMVRTFSFSLVPMLGEIESFIFGGNHVFGWGFTKQHFFNFNIFSGVFFLTILYVNRYNRRFWCRVLCPLGALLGVVSRFSILKVTIDQKSCDGCLKCSMECKMGALDFSKGKKPVSGCLKSECIMCYTCVDVCEQNCVKIHFKPDLRGVPGFGKDRVTGPSENMEGLLTRRGVIKALAFGAVAAPLIKVEPQSGKIENWRLLRPPFARIDDKEFMDLCTRCGMCIQVCSTNTLQPAYLSAGLEGMMTPVMCPEIAGCVNHCNSCGEVCPTNAILPFKFKEKYTIKQGTAKLELDRCIGWTRNSDCNKCALACPTRAIKVVTHDGVDKPKKIVAAECYGCGLCEKACRDIVVNGTAIVTTGSGRGQPTDFVTIQKTWKERGDNYKTFLPRLND